MVAVPLMTEVPAKTALEAPAGFSAPDAAVADRFLRGIGFAGQQRLVDIEITALEQPGIGGDEIAGDQFDDVAGNQLVDRNRDSSLPSRRTVACTATDARSASTAFCARTSWTKSKMMLSMHDATMMTKLATSPVAADTALAIRRMMTSGLPKRARNCSQRGERLTVAASFGP